MKISVIIPTYNEEKLIRKSMQALPMDEIEVIVADGGSTDKTVSILNEFPVKIINSRRGRAHQMNIGAREATGDILFFLHADCWLEKESFTEIFNVINPRIIAGCFSQRIDAKGIVYRMIEASGNIRARILKIFYGDQGLFVKKDIFLKVSGYPEVALFEDVLFSKILKKYGKTVVLENIIITSPRRWQKKGIIKTTLLFWFFCILYFFGFSPGHFRQLYKNIR